MGSSTIINPFMEFGIAIKNLNQLLKEKKPKEFDGSWIATNTISI